MTENTVGEVERMVVTRVFDAPHARSWFEGVDRPEVHFISEDGGLRVLLRLIYRWIFALEENFSAAWRAPDGQICGWNAVEDHEIVLHEKIVSLMWLFGLEEETRSTLRILGIEHEVIDEFAYRRTPS